MAKPRRSLTPAGAEPLSPPKKWRAITLATLLWVPGYWSILVGVVSTASDKRAAPEAGLMMAFGLCLVPFVFIVLAFLSGHPRAPGAVLRAMGLALLVGIPASALAADAVTGLVAGMGAGGIAALRRDDGHEIKSRALAVLLVAAWTFLTLRTVAPVALLLGPILPFTAIGVADHLSDRRREREIERR
ncbi:MAG TPA: hypothetical protein VEM93_05200 [Actinomycetota bacterium]|nr:hypothetical protein [Actinomycetota bacterium]